MPAEIISILVRVIQVLLASSVGLSLIFWNRLNKPFRYLSYYLMWNLLIEISTTLLAPYISNNLPLLHLYTLLEFILFSLFYFQMGIFSSWKKARFWQMMAVVSVLIILNSVFLQSIFSFNSYAKSMVQVILIAYAVAYIFQLNEKTRESAPLNLVNMAILIFYSGSLFIFMFANLMLFKDISPIFWNVNLLLNVLFQIMILISVVGIIRVRTKARAF